MEALVRQWQVWEEKKQTQEVPIRVKEVILMEILRKKRLDFVLKVNEWKETCRRILQARERYLKDDPLAELPPVFFPSKPHFHLFLSVESILKASKIAEKKKSRWERISKQGKIKGK